MHVFFFMEAPDICGETIKPLALLFTAGTYTSQGKYICV